MATRQKHDHAEIVLQVACVRAVQMYRAGFDRESVYWTLLHATHTADLLTPARG